MTVTVTRLPSLDLLKRALGRGVEELAQEVALTAPHPRIPRRVEQIAMSPGGASVEVIFDEPAAWVEFGTPAHDIVAKHKALKLPDGRFAAKVHSPGSRAKPFINPTFAAVTSRSDAVIAAGVRKAGYS